MQANLQRRTLQLRHASDLELRHGVIGIMQHCVGFGGCNIRCIYMVRTVEPTCIGDPNIQAQQRARGVPVLRIRHAFLVVHRRHRHRARRPRRPHQARRVYPRPRGGYTCSGN